MLTITIHPFPSMGADNNLFLDLHVFYTVCLIIHLMKIKQIIHLKLKKIKKVF